MSVGRISIPSLHEVHIVFEDSVSCLELTVGVHLLSRLNPFSEGVLIPDTKLAS